MNDDIMTSYEPVTTIMVVSSKPSRNIIIHMHTGHVPGYSHMLPSVWLSSFYYHCKFLTTWVCRSRDLNTRRDACVPL